MDDLYNLINQTVDKKMNSLNLIKAVPCKVVNVFENETAEVELISNKAKYTVPNYSGSKLNIGETVQLFYKGLITNNNAYIGASFNKETVVEIEKDVFRTFGSKNKLGGTLSSGSTISSISVTSKETANCLLCVNMAITGLYNDTVQIKIIRDRQTALTYMPVISTKENERIHFSCVLPWVASAQANRIDVKLFGNVYVDSAYCSVAGMNLTANTVSDISNGYKYILYSPTIGTEIAYYSSTTYYGTDLNPEIPESLGYKVTRLAATSFNYSDVVSVRIPEGVTEIE